jgi:hypothetical protein
MKIKKTNDVRELSKQINMLKKSTNGADRYRMEALKAKREKIIKSMKEENKSNLDLAINEISAEIVAGKVPARKVFNVKGEVVPLDQLKGSESLSLLAAIKSALIKTGMIKNFNADDMSNVDIKPFNKSNYILTPDVGAKKYLYNVATGKIREA